MKQVLIILRGAPASGKTTLGENLRDFAQKTVWFKTDNFKPFFSDDLEDALGAVMETSLATLNYLLQQGYSVVYEGIFKNPVYVQNAIALGKEKNIPTTVYQLECSLKTLQERDKNRKGVKEGCRKTLGDEVIESLYNEVKNTPIGGAISLNTEEKSLQECLEIIRQHFD